MGKPAIIRIKTAARGPSMDGRFVRFLSSSMHFMHFLHLIGSHSESVEGERRGRVPRAEARGRGNHVHEVQHVQEFPKKGASRPLIFFASTPAFSSPRRFYSLLVPTDSIGFRIGFCTFCCSWSVQDPCRTRAGAPPGCGIPGEYQREAVQMRAYCAQILFRGGLGL